MEPELCPICYDTITNKLNIACNHTFCSECIIKWFRHGNPQCPVCRDAPEMENSDTESEIESDTEDIYQNDINQIIDCVKNTFKTHPQNKELKQKVKECKQIRKEFKDAIKVRIQKSIEIELNKIPKKKKVLFEEVKKIKNDINKACIANTKKIDQDSISKDRIKYFVKNKVHKNIHGNISAWRMEMLSNRIDIPKELKLTRN
jgi:phage terminase Nu1 subunit (DNA packaging protein)